ncbi:hypothetical protein [Actinotalea sp.]|uniref:hypothetical protein n=1 Tax=Actinotalea sp. TaxID=1872145 RepID=UPI003568F89A
MSDAARTQLPLRAGTTDAAVAPADASGPSAATPADASGPSAATPADVTSAVTPAVTSLAPAVATGPDTDAHPDARSDGSTRHSSADPGARVPSRVAAALLGGVSAFQVALAAGAPWGEAAWGGASATVPAGLRVASGVAAIVWSGGALVALRLGGHETWAPVPDRWLRRTTIGLAAWSGVGALMNLASPSVLERAIWAPTSLAMAATLALTAARGRRDPS